MKATRMILLAMILAVISTAADPIASCDGVSTFVAHGQSLCTFYMCANKVPYEFACGKGTRVPSYFYKGNSNPCIVKVKVVECARCNVTDDVIPEAKVSNQCALFRPCATRPGCTCIDQVAGYYCSCPVSAVAKKAPTPPNIPAPDCDVNICENNGTCFELYKYKFCVCKPQFTGRFCEVDACSLTVCENGYCLADNYGIFWQCEPCFTGRCCETVLTDKPQCGNCSECFGGDDCSQLRTHLCKCNPCPDPKDSCKNGIFNRRPRTCFKPPTTASDTFSLMFEDNKSDPPYNLEVYVSAAEDDNLTRSVTVEAPLGSPGCHYSKSDIILPGSVSKFDVDACLMHNETGKKSFGIRVREVNGRFVNVYCINRGQWSADGWLALPDTVAGKLFTIISYSPVTTASQFALVAIMNNTVVNILLSRATEDIPGSEKNKLLTVNLNAYETYQVRSVVNDLSGTIIRSNNPIHVYSGEARAWVGPSSQHPDYNLTITDDSKSRDNLIFECSCMETWGYTYAIVPLTRSVIGYAYTEEAVRIAGSSPTACTYYTTISVSPNLQHNETTVILEERDFFVKQFYINAAYNYFLSCNKPVEIVEITESALIKYGTMDTRRGQYINLNDPSFIFVPAISSFSNFFRFVPPKFSRTNAPYNYTYVRLIAESKDYRGIEINDQLLYPEPPELPAQNEIMKPWTEIYVPRLTPASDYPQLYASIYRISSSEATQILHPNRDVKFMCIVEGFDDRESYAVALGASIKPLRNVSSEAFSTLLAKLDGLPAVIVY